MATLSEVHIEELLAPYLEARISVTDAERAATQADLRVVYVKVSLYLDLLVRWNQRLNLTSIRDPELMVQRHFGESLFAARELRCRVQDGASVLDFGSGAGFPGLPMQILLPTLHVTLAESQAKKAAFLREVLRALELGAEVRAERVEKLPAVDVFEAVVMRAVDAPGVALATARSRVRPGGWFMQIVSRDAGASGGIKIPGSNSGYLLIGQS